MPIVPSALGELITQKISQAMKAASGSDPLAQSDPSYFQAMCQAFATGIASGIPTISFTTTDTGFASAPPIPGTGTGTGIIIDSPYTDQAIYTYARDAVIQSFGSTTHDPYPPAPGNSGAYLQAISKGIADAVKEHFKTCFTLTSVHPLVYSGTATVSPGNFKGIQDSLIKSQIASAAPTLKGAFWPSVAESIAKGLKDSIEKKATATITITGVCITSPAQVCNLPGAGSGSGAAT